MNLESKLGNIDKRTALRKKIEKELGDLGFPVIPEIIEHLVVLEENSHFNDDSRMIIEGIKNVLKFPGSYKLKPTDQKRLLIASYFSDIGKSSSSNETACQLGVVKLFSVENIKDREHTKVGDIVQGHFSEQATDMEFDLLKVDVNFNMSMLDFHNKHTSWTLEILNKFPGFFDQEIKRIAASHHLYRGINPAEIKIDDVPNDTKYSIFLLMAMDSYQAFRKRGGLTHEEACKSLEILLRKYEGDSLMGLVLQAIGQLGIKDGLFSGSDLPSFENKK